MNTNNIVMWVILPNNAGWGLFQDSDFAGDLEDSKSTSGGTLCVFGSHTFVPISWMCKKQTSVSDSSTESEFISLDTGLRLDGLPALELWDLIVSVLGNVSRVSDNPGRPEIDTHKRQKSHNKIDVMKDIDLVPSNVWKRIARKEFGTISRKRCWWNSQRVDAQFSVQRLHCPG